MDRYAFDCLVKAKLKLKSKAAVISLLGLKKTNRNGNRLSVAWIFSGGLTDYPFQVDKPHVSSSCLSSSHCLFIHPRPLESVPSCCCRQILAIPQQHFILILLKLHRPPPKKKVCFHIQNHSSASSRAVTRPWVKAKDCNYCCIFACSLWLSKLPLKVPARHMLRSPSVWAQRIRPW